MTNYVVPWHLVSRASDFFGISPVHTPGERDDVQTSATGEDVWNGPKPNADIPIDTGEPMYLNCTSATDDTVGLGVRSVRILYLDVDGNLATIDMPTTGGASVSIGITGIYILFIETLTTGGNVSATGNIQIENQSGTEVYALIAANTNESLNAAGMVPLGFTFFPTCWAVSANNNKPISMRYMVDSSRFFSVTRGIFRQRAVHSITDAVVIEDLTSVVSFPELTIIKVVAVADMGASGADVSASITGDLVPNSQLEAIIQTSENRSRR